MKKVTKMTRTDYQPGPAAGARIHEDGDQWTLVVTRDLAHAPDVVWDAITDPAQLSEWAPFDVDVNLGQLGPATLTTVGTPAPHHTETRVTRADKPEVLEYSWGANAMRWELTPTARGTRLTLWHGIDRNYIAMGAAGWQICFDVLDYRLAGTPIGRIVAGDAMAFGWPRLHQEYRTLFGLGRPTES